MAKTKVLLVEDDVVLAKVIYEELTEAGFTTLQAYDGEAGLSMAREHHPDLVLLDILLPKKDGFEVLADLKGSPDTEDLRVILLTMLGSDDDIKKGMQLGAEDYVVKSQHAVAEVIEKVKDFISKGPRPAMKPQK